MTRKFKSVALAIAGVILIPSCASLQSATANTDSSAAGGKSADESWPVVGTHKGKASWYCTTTNRGTRTASGKPLRNHEATAAHKTLPMGTRVRVINKANGRSEIVTITDRGPYIRGRIIDVTKGVAQRLGFVASGVVPVVVEVLCSSGASKKK